MILFFDTETTGKADFKAAFSAKHQPNLVQIGACLCDEDGTERAVLDLIIKPDGWEIPADVSAIHGITQELAERCGVASIAALRVFAAMLSRADLIVAHNISFDVLVMSAAFYRLSLLHPQAAKEVERIDKVNRFCTMGATTNILKLPGPYGFKWPKLTEAYRHFFNEDFEGAHNAMVDVRACARVYFELHKPCAQ